MSKRFRNFGAMSTVNEKHVHSEWAFSRYCQRGHRMITIKKNFAFARLFLPV